jgi:hypothetical protein
MRASFKLMYIIQPLTDCSFSGNFWSNNFLSHSVVLIFPTWLIVCCFPFQQMIVLGGLEGRAGGLGGLCCVGSLYVWPQAAACLLVMGQNSVHMYQHNAFTVHNEHLSLTFHYFAKLPMKVGLPPFSSLVSYGTSQLFKSPARLLQLTGISPLLVYLFSSVCTLSISPSAWGGSKLRFYILYIQTNCSPFRYLPNRLWGLGETAFGGWGNTHSPFFVFFTVARSWRGLSAHPTVKFRNLAKNSATFLAYHTFVIKLVVFVWFRWISSFILLHATPFSSRDSLNIFCCWQYLA